MKYWEKIGLVNMKEVCKSKTLKEYYARCIAQILGLKSADEVLDYYNISENEIERLDIETFFLTSKDDPIVSYNSMPIESIKKNKKIKFVTT